MFQVVGTRNRQGTLSYLRVVKKLNPRWIKIMKVGNRFKNLIVVIE